MEQPPVGCKSATDSQPSSSAQSWRRSLPQHHATRAADLPQRRVIVRHLQHRNICQRVAITTAALLLLLSFQIVAAAPSSVESVTAAVSIERLRVRPPHRNYSSQAHRPKHVPAVRRRPHCDCLTRTGLLVCQPRQAGLHSGEVSGINHVDVQLIPNTVRLMLASSTRFHPLTVMLRLLPCRVYRWTPPCWRSSQWWPACPWGRPPRRPPRTGSSTLLSRRRRPRSQLTQVRCAALIT